MLLTRIRDIISPLLSDRTIMRLNGKGQLIDGPINPNQLQPNSVDLTLGDSYKQIRPNAKVLCRDTIDPRKPSQYNEGSFPVIDDPLSDVSELQCYILQPDEFVLMASREYLNLPNGIVSIVCGRSSIARLAIQTEQAGFIDAGFHGTITLEMHNQSKYPILLFPGMRVAQVYFIRAQRALVPYGTGKGSKYNKQILAMESKIHLDHEFHETKRTD